jgi:pimeloyl-ACP methyl ester carboxylesterase
MTTTTGPTTTLAYDIEGAGAPVVFVHGLTFTRRTWRPIIEHLSESVTSIAIDLPAHGESGGPPTDLEQVAEQLHRLLTSLGVERPVVVGHSISAGIAGLYASEYPARGIVLVDQASEVRPFAQLVHHLAPMLRGDAFDQAWTGIEASLGLELLPERTRTLVLDSHEVDRDVVLRYWDQLLRTDPADLQDWIDTVMAKVRVPCLAVFGRPATPGERARLARLSDSQVVEWAGEGHFVHLVDPGRFASQLRAFVEHCGR